MSVSRDRDKYVKILLLASDRAGGGAQEEGEARDQVQTPEPKPHEP